MKLGLWKLYLHVNISLLFYVHMEVWLKVAIKRYTYHTRHVKFSQFSTISIGGTYIPTHPEILNCILQNFQKPKA